MDSIRDFAIDGTGRVVRTGDRVVVYRVGGSRPIGSGVVAAIEDGPTIGILYDGLCETCSIDVLRIVREDDREQIRGEPLWSWM